MKMPVTMSGVVSTEPPIEGPAAFLLLEGSAVVVPVVEVEVEVAVEEAVVVSPVLLGLLVLLELLVPSVPSTAFWDPAPFKPGPVPAPLSRN